MAIVTEKDYFEKQGLQLVADKVFKVEAENEFVSRQRSSLT
jgi:hypothetical protein